MQKFNVVNLAEMDDYVIGTPIRRGKMQVTIRPARWSPGEHLGYPRRGRIRAGFGIKARGEGQGAWRGEGWMTHEQRIELRRALLSLYPQIRIFEHRLYIQAERDGIITADEYRELTS